MKLIYTPLIHLISLLILLPLCLFSDNIQAYPNQGDFPTAMGNSFFKKLSDGYNEDGTLVSNPVIIMNDGNTVTCGDSKCIRYSLKDAAASTVSFMSKNYRMYINIPTYMTINNAYGDLTSQYPSDLSSYAIPTPLSSKINNGASTPLAGTPSKSAFTDEDVYVIKTNNTGKSNSYYIPNLPNTTNSSHDGITEHVYWLNDNFLRTSSLITAPPFHMVGYGWADPALDVNSSIVLQPVNSDGGSPCAGAVPPVLFQASEPFNFLLNLFNTEYGYNSLINNIASVCKSPDKYYLSDLTDPTASKDPQWSRHGIYIPILAFPGFQRNLIRWYLPWGTWNQLNNTSDLFVRRNNGGVEIPAYQDNSNDWHPFPLVVQSWDSTRFAAINLDNGPIPLVVTNYPGNESYFPSNIFLPNQAGLIPSVENFNIYDSTKKLNPRTVDGFLAFKGNSINDATVFWGGVNPKALDPGGQANKPYLIGPEIVNGNYALRLQHSNSIFAIWGSMVILANGSQVTPSA